MSGGVAAVIVAAGRGARLGAGVPKQFLDLGGRPVLEWSVQAFLDHDEVDEVVVVLAPDRVDARPGWLGTARVVAGGETRADSVERGLAALAPDVEIVLVHDGARPFVTARLIARVLAEARSGAVIPVVAVADTIKRVAADGRIRESLDRSELAAAQTPQGFPRTLLARAHARREPGDPVTDDALLCERLGVEVRTVEGEDGNFKITTGADLERARWCVERGSGAGRRDG